MEIKTFIFNQFGVNNYVIYDETKQCAIVDAACYTDKEKQTLIDFIEKNNLTPVKIINTHTHIDHILGNVHISNYFKLPVSIHRAAEFFLQTSKEYGAMFGFNVDNQTYNVEYLNDNDIITIGNSQIKILYTPGHADGSICLYNEQSDWVITGDVLFSGSVGRSDLPTGDHEQLIENIKTKLMTLPDSTIVYPGHGPETSIKEEKLGNPFLV